MQTDLFLYFFMSGVSRRHNGFILTMVHPWPSPLGRLPAPKFDPIEFVFARPKDIFVGNKIGPR